jgi:hypothetical protein
MKANVGGMDKMLRIVGGLILIGLALKGIAAPWTWIGVVPLATGLINFCPLYTLFGFSTCAVKKAS